MDAVLERLCVVFKQGGIVVLNRDEGAIYAGSRSLGFSVWGHQPRSPHTTFILPLPFSHSQTDLLCVDSQPCVELGHSD